MTLILSLVTQEFAIQASDRMVTSLATGEVKNPNSNKMVLPGNRMVFGFSGVAELGGVTTDEWLGQILMRDSLSDLATTFEKIRLEASSAIARLNYSKRHKRLAFVGVGWTKKKGDERYYPIMCRISNFHPPSTGAAGAAEGTDEFSAQWRIHKPPESYWGWLEVGARIGGQQQWLQKRLNQCARKLTGPDPVARLFVEAIRHTHRSNHRAGRDVLVSVIPHHAAGSNEIMLLNPSFASPAALTAADHMQFKYFPENANTGVQYGPIVTGGNNLVSNFRVEPVRPRQVSGHRESGREGGS